jgi:methylenetetrahydrofolate--tRNA-(uracil-5-)-methyltransferase
MGLLAGRFAADARAGRPSITPPPSTALGALLNHITGGADATSFQPMNVNFGLFPPFPERIRKSDRKQAYCRRALADMDGWLSASSLAAE